MPGTLIELWQCNAAGRYHHPVDQHDAPLDPNFTGAGQAITDKDGAWRFLTITPGHYPWRNDRNAWRAHQTIVGPGDRLKRDEGTEDARDRRVIGAHQKPR